MHVGRPVHGLEHIFDRAGVRKPHPGFYTSTRIRGFNEWLHATILRHQSFPLTARLARFAPATLRSITIPWTAVLFARNLKFIIAICKWM